jgi:hypothetical protein
MKRENPKTLEREIYGKKSPESTANNPCGSGKSGRGVAAEEGNTRGLAIQHPAHGMSMAWYCIASHRTASKMKGKTRGLRKDQGRRIARNPERN